MICGCMQKICSQKLDIGVINANASMLPKAPGNLNADLMSASQIRNKLDEGLSDIENGRERPAREAFRQSREGNCNEAL